LPLLRRTVTAVADGGGMDTTTAPALALRALLAALAVVLLIAAGTALALLTGDSAWAPPF
jgi:hypothetical protein